MIQVNFYILKQKIKQKLLKI